jgi:hypothetical protein
VRVNEYTRLISKTLRATLFGSRYLFPGRHWRRPGNLVVDRTVSRIIHLLQETARAGHLVSRRTGVAVDRGVRGRVHCVKESTTLIDVRLAPTRGAKADLLTAPVDVCLLGVKRTLSRTSRNVRV